jgi:F-type H+-transporting ATPase subunit a
MYLLAAGDQPNPLGHVLDHTLLEYNGVPVLTLHMITLVVAGLLTWWVMAMAARAIDTGSESEGNRRYVARSRTGQLIEVIILGLRDQMLRPLLGRETCDKYQMYLLSLFFFILFNNLLGLVPLIDLQNFIGGLVDPEHGLHFAVVGGTATGNLGVNAGLALVAFLVIQAHGLKENGIGGWAHHFLGGAPWWLAPIMVPVEILGMIIKPCALAIRLFANMLAGHTLMATLFLFGSMAYAGLQSYLAASGVTIASGLFALAIYCLELFVAVLQAFVFMFLTAVFISQLSHHGDHDAEHAHDAHGEPVTV